MPNSSLTIGKRKGLAGTSNSNKVFTVLALDHRQSFAKMLRPSDPDSVRYDEIVKVKSAFVQAISPVVSAVLLDPVYGAAQIIASGALSRGAGMLVAVEETGYTGEPTARLSSLLPGWDIEKSKRMGAEAIKLLVYYHPHAGELAQKQEALVAEVVEACRRADLALFLEILTYSIDPNVERQSAQFAANLPEVMVDIATRMSALQPDILKLEFPVNAKFKPDERDWMDACWAVSRASSVPWTVLSAGADFDLFSRQVEAACQAGASGFIAGRSVWKEGVSMPDSERERWLQDVAVARMTRLAEIASQHGKPWTDFYPTPDLSELDGWYERYSS